MTSRVWLGKARLEVAKMNTAVGHARCRVLLSSTRATTTNRRRVDGEVLVFVSTWPGFFVGFGARGQPMYPPVAQGVR